MEVNMPSQPGSVKLKKVPASKSCRITDSGHRHHRRAMIWFKAQRESILQRPRGFRLELASWE
jgi:hypothetical protein